jgi:hypothetical protein
MDAYRVTRHAGSTIASSGVLLCTTQREDEAQAFFIEATAMPDTTLALWKPGGDLMAVRSGPAREVSA